MAVQQHNILSLTSGNLQQNHCICIKAIAPLKVYLFSLLIVTPRPCTILPSSMRWPLTGRKLQRSGKSVWMRRCGRRRSAGCSARWRPSGYPKTGEWTASTACLRRPQVRKHLQSWYVFFKLKNKEPKRPFFLFFIALSLSLLACRQYCVTQVATRPGRISSQEDFLPTQLEHLHIAQFKGEDLKQKVIRTSFSVAAVLVICPSVDFLYVHAHCCYAHYVSLSIICFCFAPPSAGDISGAVQTLRSLLLFYPSDKDSLDNLQLYSETLGGDTESQGIQPTQVPLNDHYTVQYCHHQVIVLLLLS